MSRPLAGKGLIVFLMAGFPDYAGSLQLALAVLDEGVVALEIGVPFSDPVADGAVIQVAAATALRNGMTLRRSLQLACEIKQQRPNANLVLFTYLNPIRKMGLEEFVQLASESGVDSTLVVDLPPEEAGEHVRAHRAAGLGTVFLASPTSSVERLAKVAEFSSSFIYGISCTGITGAKASLSTSLAAEIATLREHSRGLPIGVGFGISNSEQATEVARFADAVVIGSRFLSLIQESATISEAESKVRQLARECIHAIASVHGESNV